MEALAHTVHWLLGSILLGAGGAFMVVGGIGVLRMPTLYTRIHAAGLTDSLGPILILGGLMLHVETAQELFKLAGILLFMLITGPTATYALANAALMAGVQTDAPAENESPAEKENPA